jgi:hypothetical protein
MQRAWSKWHACITNSLSHVESSLDMRRASEAGKVWKKRVETGPFPMIRKSFLVRLIPFFVP